MGLREQDEKLSTAVETASTQTMSASADEENKRVVETAYFYYIQPVSTGFVRQNAVETAVLYFANTSTIGQVNRVQKSHNIDS
ncbi:MULTISPECIES: hypothetical protein [unclassified Microcoleus]|uniref:hypothetical protein n=1 Tax=unclassified Microcoleus TaxID=2642155 RepID=UPI002FD059D0